jgi:hypothetical protein
MLNAGGHVDHGIAFWIEGDHFVVTCAEAVSFAERGLL